MKIDEIRKMVLVEVKPIQDIKKYQGFYFELEDGYIEANFCSYPEKGLEVEYSLGFETNGKSVVAHLFDKIKNKERLNRNEKVAFYEKVDLFRPVVQVMGKWYDFREILHKIKGVEFYILGAKPSKKEIKLFHEEVTFVDIKLLGAA